MDVITKGGVIWEYLKGEVAAGKENITKADLMKVGYSAQAVENAIAEIKKEKMLNKSAMPAPLPPTAAPAPVMGSSSAPFVIDEKITLAASPAPMGEAPLLTHPADQELMNNLNAAVKQDAEIKSVPPATPVGFSSAPLGTKMPTAHENLGATLAGISALSPELVHASVPENAKLPVQAPVNSTASQPATLPSSPLMMPKAAVAEVAPKKKRGFFAKLLIFLFVIVVLVGIGSGVSYGMTGQWIPPIIIEKLGDLPFVQDAYPKDKIFSIMLGNLSAIKKVGYTATFDLKTEPYDGATARPIILNSGSSSPQGTDSAARSMGIGGLDINVITDISLHANAAGSADLSDSSNILNKDSEMHGTVEGSIGGVSFTSEAGLIKLGDTTYVRISKLPSFGEYDLASIDGKWVTFDKSSLEELGLRESSGGHLLEMKTPSISTLVKELQASGISAGFVAEEKVGKEKTWKYEVSLRDNNGVMVWISPKTALPVKALFSSKVAYGADDPKMKDKMTVLEVSMTISNINEEVKLTAPAETISAVEAYAAMLGMTTEQYYERKQETNVEGLSYALADFKKVAGVYPASLSELTQTPNQIRAAYPKTAPKKTPAKAGFDFAPWSDDMPVMEKVPVDVFTKAEFPYTAAKGDFTLKYEIRLPVAAPAMPKVVSKFVNGTNTMTSKMMSVEGAAANAKKK